LPQPLSLSPFSPAARRYTAFTIELKTHGGLVWTVERRFSQFHKLNEVRDTSSGNLPVHI
jgi:hypothetical protein